MGTSVQLSIVIPLFNEEELVAPLVEEIETDLSPLGDNYEIVLVNDGSTDHTSRELENIRRKYPCFIRIVSYPQNCGQGWALRAGFKKARGTYIAVLDGDMQFDPKDILVLYQKLLDQKYDFICGRRKSRRDSLFLKTLPSKVGNRLICWIFDVNLNDLGCALKIGEAKAILGIPPLFRNYHRYLSLLLIMSGAKYCEMEVTHRKRLLGKTKYSIFKVFGVIKEIFLIKFFYRFE